jgi:hypothetical protein
LYHTASIHTQEALIEIHTQEALIERQAYY